MTAYVYVVCGPDLKNSKLGFSENFRSRFSGLASSSASSVKWMPWRLFRFCSAQEAREVEAAACNDEAIQTYRMPDKVEFFSCSPVELSRAIERQAARLRIDMLRDFPYSIIGVEEVSGNFPGMPREVHNSLQDDARCSYWIGVRDALMALQYLDGLELRKEDMLSIYMMIKAREIDQPEVWRVIFEHYRIGATVCEKHRSLAKQALEKAEKDHRAALEDWQDLDEQSA